MSESADILLAERVKAAHRSFPTGVTIVTTQVDGRPYGLAVNAFASISLSPPLVLVCVADSSATHEHLFGAERLAVNVLAHDQAEIAEAFARSGGDKFSDLAWHVGDHDTPLLDGVAAQLELALTARIPAYTHTIFVARVLAAATFERPPLVYLGGRLYDGATLGVTAPHHREVAS